MCQSGSSKIFAALPANVQSDALLYGFEMMLGKGEWLELNEVLGQALMQPEADAGRILALAALTALRLGKKELAIARCGQLPQGSLLKMKTLFQIAAQLLPCGASELLQIWLAAASESLADEACSLWLKTGELLEQALRGDHEKIGQIREAIARKTHA